MKDDLDWAELPWNIVTGCTRVSKGCRHCRGELRWPQMSHPQGVVARKFTEVMPHPERLQHPLQMTNGQTIHVAPGSDLFHDSVPIAFVAAVFAVIAANPSHTYQILTRRHQRLPEVLATLADMPREEWLQHYLSYVPGADVDVIQSVVAAAPWPLPNVWLGVVVEDQETAQSGITALMDAPTHRRSIHVEPLMGEIRLAAVKWDGGDWTHLVDWLVVGSRHFQKESFPLPLVSALQRECHDVGIPFVLKNISI